MGKCKNNLSLSAVDSLTKRYKSVKRLQVNDLILFDYVYADNKLFKEHCGKEVRGVVFHESGQIVSRPLHKFFNHAESLAPVEFTPMVLGEKIDGSMLQVTVNPITNKIFVASRSSHNPSKSYVINAYNRLPKKVKTEIERLARKYPEYTHIFEIVDPGNQIVIFYDTLEVHYLISRNKLTGAYSIIDRTEVSEELNPLKWTSFNKSNSMEELLAKARTEKGIEGWVVYDKIHEDFIKIKTLWYLERHKITTLSLPEHYLSAWIDNEIDDYISYAELVGGKKVDIVRRIKAALDLELKLFLENGLVEKAIQLANSVQSRKDAAIQLKELLKNTDNVYKSIIFSGIMGKFENEDSEKLSEVIKLYKKSAKRPGQLRKHLLSVIVDMLYI